MKMSIGRKLNAGLLVLALVVAVPAYAAKHSGPGMMDGKDGAGMMQMSGMMQDMSGQMMSMSGDMSKGNMSADMQKQMAGRMKQMSQMMEMMSGMMGKGMMMDTGQQKQMEQMRQQMDDMKKQSPPPVRKR